MNYSDDAFVTLLLTMSLSPNREEFARPLSTAEMHQLEERVRKCDIGRIGRLANIDISGLMLKLGISEEEAYRIYTLMNREVQISYSLENFLKQEIEVVTCRDADYPRRLHLRMDAAAPQIFYRCGNLDLLNRPMLAVVGISGVKTTAEVRKYVETIVDNGIRLGYTLLTGGELGVSRVVANLVLERGGTLVEVLGGDMAAHMHEDGIAELIAMQRAAVISLEHPEALFTVSHGIARNKVLFSLAEAAFVFNTDGKRGETDALRNRYCDWIYAWTGHAGAAALVSRGAIGVNDVTALDFDDLSRHWKNSQSEQMSLFDMLDHLN